MKGTIRTRALGTLACVVTLMAFGPSAAGTYCFPYSQTREACEDMTGTCQFTAWNFKIFYTKNYNCCYNNDGSFSGKVGTSTTGPTSPQDGQCCQDLQSVSFTDGKWALPCPSTHAITPAQ